MKKASLLLALSLLMWACNSVHTEGKKTVVIGEDTLTNVSFSTSKTGALEELTETLEAEETKAESVHFKAGGTEPGWSLEVVGRKATAVLDYGKDTLVFSENFGNIGSARTSYTYNQVVNKKVLTLSLDVEQKSCTDAAGVVKPQTVTFKVDGKTYTGCGAVIKD